ncbi:MAG: hypothetical protein WAS27_01245 [Candidatus Saccharimonadales bacterium]
MRTLLNKISSSFSNNPILTLGIALIAALVIPLSVLAWGPDRETFTIEKPATYVTFNSITNNPAHGDERNFMQIREKEARNETYTDEISVAGGKEYVVYVYYHNNAASNYNASGQGVAKDAYARAEIPAIVPNGSSTKAAAYVGASNAKPVNVYDDITFKNTTGADISLRYVPGSTTIHNFGKTNGQTMPDTILGGSGVKLGYDTLDGTLPGCNEYAGYITFRVAAVQPNFTFKKDVRVSGTKEWKDSVAAKPGETVDYLLTYKNTGTVDQTDVTFKDELPAGITYVNGSTKLTNGNNPNGKVLSDEINAGGMNVGSYAPGAAAYLVFSATVAGADCTLLTNRAAVTTNNGSREDTASVTVGDENCEPAPEALPTTGPAEIIAAFLGIAAITFGTVYYFKSRRELKELLATVQNPHATTTKQATKKADDTKQVPTKQSTVNEKTAHNNVSHK